MPSQLDFALRPSLGFWPIDRIFPTVAAPSAVPWAHEDACQGVIPSDSSGAAGQGAIKGFQPVKERGLGLRRYALYDLEVICGGRLQQWLMTMDSYLQNRGSHAHTFTEAPYE